MVVDYFKFVYDYRLKGIKKIGREKCLVGLYLFVILFWFEWFLFINVKKIIYLIEKEFDIIDKMILVIIIYVIKIIVMFEVNYFFLELIVCR